MLTIMCNFVNLSQIFLLLAIVSLSMSAVRHHPQVHCETTKGPVKIEVYPEWSPLGAERFLTLVTDEFYTNIALYRSVKRFLVQFGISDNPIKKHWHGDNIPDDPNLHMGIRKNYLSFAGGGPNTRSTQLFIAFEDLDFLGNEPWETPFGKVIEGQQTLDHLYKDYGDIPPFGDGPDQQQIYSQGNAYIRSQFPRVDFIKFCSLIELEPENIAPVQIKEQDGFIPEDDDHKVQTNSKQDSARDNKILHENMANERQPSVSEGSAGPSSFDKIIIDLEEVEEYHGNLRDRDAVLEKDIATIPSMLSSKDVIALRALFLLVFVAIAMFFYGKYFYSSSYAASSSKRQ